MISDEAVEAAKEAMLSKDGGNLPGEDWEEWQRRVARLAIEAAAPHLFAQLLALADERDETPGAIRGHVTTYEVREALNPYRSQA